MPSRRPSRVPRGRSTPRGSEAQRRLPRPSAHPGVGWPLPGPVLSRPGGVESWIARGASSGASQVPLWTTPARSRRLADLSCEAVLVSASLRRAKAFGKPLPPNPSRRAGPTDTFLRGICSKPTDDESVYTASSGGSSQLEHAQLWLPPCLDRCRWPPSPRARPRPQASTQHRRKRHQQDHSRTRGTGFAHSCPASGIPGSSRPGTTPPSRTAGIGTGTPGRLVGGPLAQHHSARLKPASRRRHGARPPPARLLAKTSPLPYHCAAPARGTTAHRLATPALPRPEPACCLHPAPSNCQPNGAPRRALGPGRPRSSITVTLVPAGTEPRLVGARPSLRLGHRLGRLSWGSRPPPGGRPACR